MGQAGFLLRATVLLSLLVVSVPVLIVAEAEPTANNYVFRRSWGSLGDRMDFPGGVAVEPDGTTYVVNTGLSRITRISPVERTFSGWGDAGNGNGQFSSPIGIAVDGDGNVYVADTGNDRIQKFTNSGAYLTQWGSSGSGSGQFNTPGGMAVDGSGNVYVADTNNYRIQKFTSSGAYLTQWGSFFSAGIAVDSSGNVYVADSGNDLIQMFSDGYPPPDPVSGLALNGSFEGAPALIEWTYGGSLPVSRETNAIHGTYALRLGIPVPKIAQGEGQAWAHQTFYVDPSWSRPVLSFAYNMWVNDTIHYSDFFVEIQDGAGLNHLTTVLRDGFPCNYAPAPATNLGWRTQSYDLSAYKGQSIRLVFANRNLHPGSLGIWTYVDDVRVVDAGPLPPYAVYLPNVMKNAPSTSCP